MIDKSSQDDMKREKVMDDNSDDKSDPMLKKYMDPVIKEAIIELSLIKSSFESLNGRIRKSMVNDIQDHLRLITGALVMLSLGRAASILHSCGHYISRLLSADESANIDRQGAQLFMGIIADLSRYLGGFPEEADFQEDLLVTMEDKATQIKQLPDVNVANEAVPAVQPTQSGTVSHDRQLVSIGEAGDDISTIPLQGREKINVELKRNFLHTARKNIKAGSMVLHMLGKSPDSTVLVKEFGKILHALKYSALAAGISEVVELCHCMELLVTMLVQREDQDTDEINELLTQSYEQLTAIVEQYNHQETLTPVEELVIRINKRLTSSLKGAQYGRQQNARVRHTESRRTLRRRTDKKDAALQKKIERRHSAGLEKDQSGQIDAYVTEMGDVQTGIEESYSMLKSYQDEMKREIVQLRDRLCHDMVASFSSSEMPHNGSDNPRNNNVLTGYLDEFEKLYDQSKQLMNMVGECLVQQQQIFASMKAKLRQTRIIAVASQIAQFEKYVDKMGREHAKKVKLEVIGGHVRLEQALLERLIEPLKYLVGFGVEHSIEEPVHRISSGKPENGSITLEFTKENSDLVIKVYDDGAGTDLDELRNAAVNLGYVDSKNELTDAEVAALVFNPGFNKESNIPWLKTQNILFSDLAYMIKSIGGSIVLTTVKDQGSTIIIRLSCELDTSQVLMVQVNDEIYAIPTASIKEVVYLDDDEIDALYSSDDSLYEYNGHEYQFRSLGVVLGKTPSVQPQLDGQYPVVLMSMGNKHIALQVNKIKGQREIIVNQPVPELNRVKVISGATLLSDGRLVLVLELGALLGEDVGNLKAINKLSIG